MYCIPVSRLFIHFYPLPYLKNRLGKEILTTPVTRGGSRTNEPISVVN